MHPCMVLWNMYAHISTVFQSRYSRIMSARDKWKEFSGDILQSVGYIGVLLLYDCFYILDGEANAARVALKSQLYGVIIP